MIRKRRAFRHKNWKIITIPNILTFCRIAVIPFLILSFYCSGPIGNFFALFLFVLASLTDYVDGYVARRLKLTSNFGAFLDPIADKLLITVTLLMLAGLGRISSYNLIPAAIIVCREVTISGLREFLAAMGLELPVLRLAKYKTVVQMVAIASLLCNNQVYYSSVIAVVGNILLWFASLLTLITGVSYVMSALTFIKILQKQSRQAIPQKRKKRVKAHG
ncbi:MAG: CDP-diacylglycerol--glycerol-3-phosphate 3-phosphatidyltransferase [Holosporales bacterium]|jgi:cardiolipin synthase|nr:CDP-diacylglycerol--glycerol-3-phosphate 3-phosphatidyltransferase [Holosporales bacterium]